MKLKKYISYKVLYFNESLIILWRFLNLDKSELIGNKIYQRAHICAMRFITVNWKVLLVF